jgi:hypothetical protein
MKRWILKQLSLIKQLQFTTLNYPPRGEIKRVPLQIVQTCRPAPLRELAH